MNHTLEFRKPWEEGFLTRIDWHHKPPSTTPPEAMIAIKTQLLPSHFESKSKSRMRKQHSVFKHKYLTQPTLTPEDQVMKVI